MLKNLLYIPKLSLKTKGLFGYNLFLLKLKSEN